MKQVYLPDGSSMPQLGQGTWQMGEDDNKYEREIAGLRHGVELGMNLIDTAEMYADGKAENIAGNAAKAFARKSLYICDKVHPQNANKQHIYSSAERSLKLLERIISTCICSTGERTPTWGSGLLYGRFKGSGAGYADGVCPTLTWTIWKTYGKSRTAATAASTRSYTIWGHAA